MEIVEEMRGVSFLALEDYKKKNDGFPARIIVYRDGVGQGQFDEIRNVEIRALKSAMESIKCEAKLTYIIVQKRHHVRLFPVGHENQDKSSNCVPGTIIDSEITRPGDFNFVLQSHAGNYNFHLGLKGMSRPTFYHLIHDENNFASDDIEQISYNLCFLSERATRSISLPAPAYRAHLAAYCNYILI
jgi:eukaryotic translation initiation factor 2C